jgi:metal-responsive CopG/Arc/MetJ family transcriptional regulator
VKDDTMPERKALLIAMDADLVEGLDKLRERDGINYSEAVRRAVRAWLEAKDALAPRLPRLVKKGRP